MLTLKDFLIEKNARIIDALQQIDKNTKGFVVVVNGGKLAGTLTDGDIRRAIISGRTKNDTIENDYTMHCKSICVDDSFDSVIEAFKNSAIEFLPVIDKAEKVVNVITKKQMHSLLMQDISVELTYDFINVDEQLVEHEIYCRPWGFYKTTVLNDVFQSKIINIRPRASISLQLHKFREEHWIIVHGTGTAQIGQSFVHVTGGSTVFIPKGCKHRLMNESADESLIFVEVQIGEYFGEDDIVRFEDDYGRT